MSTTTVIRIEDVDDGIGNKVQEVQALNCRVYLILSIAIIIYAFAFLFIFVESSLNAAAGTEVPTIVQPIMYIVMMVATVSISYFGLWFTHRYGGISQQAKILEEASKVLRAGAAAFDLQINDLDAQISVLENAVTKRVRGTQDLLAGVVLEGENIGKLTQRIKGNDEETTQFIQDVNEIMILIHILQRQINKNEIMKMFYEISNDDGEEGLSKNEYLKLMDRLNKETADAFREEFKSWKKMDKDKNGKIDAKEFEDALDKIFDRLDERDRQIINQRNK